MRVLGSPSTLHHAPGGGARSDEIVDSRLHVIGDLESNGPDGLGVGERGRGFSALGEAGLGGNGEIAVQPGVDAALAVELLVDIQHLLLSGAARLLLQPQSGQPPGIPGASAKYGGVDLHSGGDASHGVPSPRAL